MEDKRNQVLALLTAADGAKLRELIRASLLETATQTSDESFLDKLLEALNETN